jgi:hypothetical protein
VDVLVPVDEVRRAAELRLESRELPLDLLPDLVFRKRAEKRATQESAQGGEPAVRRESWGPAERRAEGQRQVQSDPHPGVERLKLAGTPLPSRPVGHRARRRDAAGPGEVENAPAHAVGQAEIVGAKDEGSQHAHLLPKVKPETENSDSSSDCPTVATRPTRVRAGADRLRAGMPCPAP